MVYLVYADSEPVSRSIENRKCPNWVCPYIYPCTFYGVMIYDIHGLRGVECGGGVVEAVLERILLSDGRHDSFKCKHISPPQDAFKI